MQLGARNIRLFGSDARGDGSPAREIDLPVDVSISVGLFAFGRMRCEAERILGSSVDNVPANSLKPDIPWTDISCTGNQFAQRYFDTARSIVRAAHSKAAAGRPVPTVPRRGGRNSSPLV